MNLLELQDILGNTILEVTDKNKSDEEHKISLTNAEYIAKIAKQMINNADIVLRSEKLMQEGYEMQNTREMIGEK
ncbi:hypothetical protein KQI68_06835 [Peptoniphilus sp. MSJ-1]|uniref:Uncharacterized protein n=1 Tax=Peptoniphilus ovalis TaxID=2841503 RepID=A0ABS6FHC1_9FIRM|nr:hypothetical protein [Peptoniphilus ovalis]MBU5669554.1 hypothetical protein [Peptoniphilus ovalis]